MTFRAKIVLSFIFSILAIVLWINVRYLFVAPIPNTWVWWPGDETWLLSEYKNFLQTGHYVNPLAPGSIYAQCSGLLFGSCYITAVLYALPILVVGNHSIAIGRIVTECFSFATIIALWFTSKRYNVSSVLRAFGCLLLSSTLCFFIMSHSARSDMLIGLVILLLTAYFASVDEATLIQWIFLIGLLIPLSLLINGHVLIIASPMFLFVLWNLRTWKELHSLALFISGVASGFIILLAVQFLLLGSTSVTGPFTDYTPSMPLIRILHPRAQWTNYNWRIFIAQAWASGVLWSAIVLLLFIVIAQIKKIRFFNSLTSSEWKLLFYSGLVVASSVYIEYYLPRYLIYVLPTIVLIFLVITSALQRILPKAYRTSLQFALAICVSIGLWQYRIQTEKMGEAGSIITQSNEAVLRDALGLIHAQFPGRPRVFASVPCQAVPMDDSIELLTPVLFDWRIDRSLSRSDVWNRSRINFAIVCSQDREGNRSVADSSIRWAETSGGRLIYEKVGDFSDMDRSYDPLSLKYLDTMRVYEYQ